MTVLKKINKPTMSWSFEPGRDRERHQVCYFLIPKGFTLAASVTDSREMEGGPRLGEVAGPCAVFLYYTAAGLVNGITVDRIESISVMASIALLSRTADQVEYRDGLECVEESPGADVHGVFGYARVSTSQQMIEAEEERKGG
jgi:hypothetical protein